MGQYFLIVNPVKRQYLDPHKFGCGLKLMEFTNTPYGPQQALCILLAHSNGRGGGDLGTENLTDEEKALIGSWAGDPVYVAGDYDDPWFGVPDDLKGKTYTEREELYQHSSGRIAPYSQLPSGSSRATGKYKDVTYTFGKRYNRETGQDDDCNETLYSAARAFFEDISDKVIALVAKGEDGYHPWAAIDLKDWRGWRQTTEWDILPETEPKKPAGGKKVYNAFKKHAKPAWLDMADRLADHILRNPEAAEVVAELVKDKMAAAVKAAKERKQTAASY